MRYIHKRKLAAALLGLALAFGLGFGSLSSTTATHSIPAGMLAEDPGGHGGGGG